MIPAPQKQPPCAYADSLIKHMESRGHMVEIGISCVECEEGKRIKCKHYTDRKEKYDFGSMKMGVTDDY